VVRVAVDEFFQMFDMSIRSRDIRDRSRKLSEIAPNFGRFFTLPNFRGPAFQKLYPFYHPYLRVVTWKWFCKNTPISLEVLVAHTLNLKPNFKFSRLKFLEDPRPSFVMCATKAWSICNACKNLSGQHPPPQGP